MIIKLKINVNGILNFIDKPVSVKYLNNVLIFYILSRYFIVSPPYVVNRPFRSLSNDDSELNRRNKFFRQTENVF